MIGSAKCESHLKECSLHTPQLLLFSGSTKHGRLLIAFKFTKMIFLHIFAFILCVSVGHSLKCYFCISSSSWDDCKTQEITCPSSANRCSKAYTKVKQDGNTITGYAKSCFPESSCKDYKSGLLCKGTEDCQLNCCSGDLCNTAAMQVVSVVFLVLCAFLASVMTP
ncbi:PREDICTED: lymphocyte antigen 6 complex locus protein G6d-like isoform X1 [Acropora digitifera]|uniref:lymphocyte antigen 6 complex locus protein G6d-like isoform X1 n=1 Tax=Acropora digitifera TaxID=70779 RepID=UPI00077A0C23|nr:PREDICTED: lymphocyte antigen 6 complex locus protein G6d-like isoform X1 [Acropora digitifera]